MFSPLHERAEALEERLEEVGAALAGRAGVPAEAMSVGRICTEADASKVNAASVTLELARSAAGAGRLSLDLREVPSFSVFPGQVVGVQGAATGADRLAVTALFADGAAPYAATPVRNARALAAARRAGGPTRVWVAAGPFTDAKNLDYEPLQEFLAEATQAEKGKMPDAIVLVGPFVDADHPMIKAGTATRGGDVSRAAAELERRVKRRRDAGAGAAGRLRLAALLAYAQWCGVAAGRLGCVV
jgi:DNA polymerase alpha subunit B